MLLIYLRPQISSRINTMATNNNMEPLAYSMYEMGTTMSDNYSYLDQSSEEMGAKGRWGNETNAQFCKITLY